MFVDALAARDGPRAAALMAEHLEHILGDLALAARPEIRRSTSRQYCAPQTFERA